MIVCDTSGLFAALDESERHHEAAAQVVRDHPGPFLLPPFVLAELDHLLGSRLGVEAELALLSEVARGAYRLVPFDDQDGDQASSIVRKYRDLGVGLADASLVVVAARYGTTRLLTLDERHFRAMRPLRGGRSFTLLPSDAK